MSKFQSVSFDSIAEFLDYLPENELKVLEVLRTIIFSTLPQCTERLSYNVPFYYGYSRMVFLWPGAVPWGGLREPGVQLGFCKGNLLPSKDLLDQGERKEVYSLLFRTVAEIDVEFVKMMLLEAMEVDKVDFKFKSARKARRAKDDEALA